MNKPRASHEVIDELVTFAYGIEESSFTTDEELVNAIEEIDDQLRAEGIDPQRVVAKLHQRLGQMKNRQNVARLRAILDDPADEGEPSIDTMRRQLPGIMNNGAFAARNFDQLTDADVVELWRIAQGAKRAGEQP